MDPQPGPSSGPKRKRTRKRLTVKKRHKTATQQQQQQPKKRPRKPIYHPRTELPDPYFSPDNFLGLERITAEQLPPSVRETQAAAQAQSDNDDDDDEDDSELILPPPLNEPPSQEILAAALAGRPPPDREPGEIDPRDRQPAFTRLTPNERNSLTELAQEMSRQMINEILHNPNVVLNIPGGVVIPRPIEPPTPEGRLQAVTATVVRIATLQADTTDVCPICLDSIAIKAITSPCTHQFCLYCLCEWSKDNTHCPLCRRGVAKILFNFTNGYTYNEYRLPDHVRESLCGAYRDHPLRGVLGLTNFDPSYEWAARRTHLNLMQMVHYLAEANPGQCAPLPEITLEHFQRAQGGSGALRLIEKCQIPSYFRAFLYINNYTIEPHFLSMITSEGHHSLEHYRSCNPAATKRLVQFLLAELNALQLVYDFVYSQPAVTGLLELALDEADLRSAAFRLIFRYILLTQTSLEIAAVPKRLLESLYREVVHFAHFPYAGLYVYYRQMVYIRADPEMEVETSSQEEKAIQRAIEQKTSVIVTKKNLKLLESLLETARNNCLQFIDVPLVEKLIGRLRSIPEDDADEIPVEEEEEEEEPEEAEPVEDKPPEIEIKEEPISEEEEVMVGEGDDAAEAEANDDEDNADEYSEDGEEPIQPAELPTSALVWPIPNHHIHNRYTLFMDGHTGTPLPPAIWQALYVAMIRNMRIARRGRRAGQGNVLVPNLPRISLRPNESYQRFRARVSAALNRIDERARTEVDYLQMVFEDVTLPGDERAAAAAQAILFDAQAVLEMYVISGRAISDSDCWLRAPDPQFDSLEEVSYWMDFHSMARMQEIYGDDYLRMHLMAVSVFDEDSEVEEYEEEEMPPPEGEPGQQEQEPEAQEAEAELQQLPPPPQPEPQRLASDDEQIVPPGRRSDDEEQVMPMEVLAAMINNQNVDQDQSGLVSLDGDNQVADNTAVSSTAAEDVPPVEEDQVVPIFVNNPIADAQTSNGPNEDLDANNAEQPVEAGNQQENLPDPTSGTSAFNHEAVDEEDPNDPLTVFCRLLRKRHPRYDATKNWLAEQLFPPETRPFFQGGVQIAGPLVTLSNASDYYSDTSSSETEEDEAETTHIVHDCLEMNNIGRPRPVVQQPVRCLCCRPPNPNPRGRRHARLARIRTTRNYRPPVIVETLESANIVSIAGPAGDGVPKGFRPRRHRRPGKGRLRPKPTLSIAPIAVNRIGVAGPSGLQNPVEGSVPQQSNYRPPVYEPLGLGGPRSTQRLPPQLSDSSSNDMDEITRKVRDFGRRTQRLAILPPNDNSDDDQSEEEEDPNGQQEVLSDSTDFTFTSSSSSTDDEFEEEVPVGKIKLFRSRLPKTFDQQPGPCSCSDCAAPEDDSPSTASSVLEDPATKDTLPQSPEQPPPIKHPKYRIRKILSTTVRPPLIYSYSQSPEGRTILGQIFERRQMRLIIRRAMSSPYYYGLLMGQVHRLFNGEDTILTDAHFYHLTNLFIHMKLDNINAARVLRRHRDGRRRSRQQQQQQIWSRTLEELLQMEESFEAYCTDEVTGRLIMPMAAQCIHEIKWDQLEYNREYDVYEDDE